MAPDPSAALKREAGETEKDPKRGADADLPKFELPDLGPLQQTLEAAQDKAAAIGTVNPRPGGFVNSLVQSTKRLVARLLAWHVREQVEFNRAMVRFVHQIRDASVISNQSLLRVAREVDKVKERQENIAQRISDFEIRGADLAQQVADLRRHWTEWHPAWEEKLTAVEIRFLHLIREMETARRQWEEAQEQARLRMHGDYQQALSHATEELQQKFWDDLQKLQNEQERLIQTELRLIRRRARVEVSEPAKGAGAEPLSTARPVGSQEVSPLNGAGPVDFDYARFEERFRGDEAYVAESQSFYVPYFEDCQRVVDLGCGRGEFLYLLRQRGVTSTGVDRDPDAVAACREKGLEVAQGDLFDYLLGEPDSSLDGVFSAHVVEHLPPGRIPELVSLAARKLRAGGVLAVETPNPNCLAIYASDFYLDPTHWKPVPANLMHFYLQEGGFTGIETHELHPASEAFPEIAALDQLEELREFRRKFFGGRDYAIMGRKPAS